MTAAVADGAPVDVEYDVYTEAPEEDEYVVARALADFIPEEEGRFIALEMNAPVFIFTKHVSGWWTGECKGKYGLFPSNFVTEEFHVILRPKTAGVEGEGLEAENRANPGVAGNESSSEGSDDDTDSDEEEEGDEEDEEDEPDEAKNPNGSPPITIPSSSHATPEKQHSVPHLSIPSTSDSFLSDTSKLTPVSRQLGEFVDRLNESTRTPNSSNPTTPTRLGTSPRYPLMSTPRKGSVGAVRAHRVDSLGDLMVMDPETSKLTPVSRQLGEFVERLNQSRSSIEVTSANSSIGKGKSRNGEPIFNVFDGLLADIESLRSTGPLEGEWDDTEDVYNTPEAARARIAIDVKTLRDELEHANSARISVESDIARLREEFTAQLEVERKGRIILEKRLSEREIVLPNLAGGAVVHSITKESKYTETDPEINPLQQELDESKAKNRILEKELEKLQQSMFNLHRKSEGSLQRNAGERNEITQELERQMTINKQLETELKRMTEEAKIHTGQNIQQLQDTEQKHSEEIKVLRAEVEALRAEKEQFEKQSADQVRIAKEQVARQKDEMFFIEREQLIQQKYELMQVELRNLREREEERTKSALEDRSKQLDAVIAAHEETRKRLELERDQAREQEAATAKELEELKVKNQKQKVLPPKPPIVEPKAAKVAEKVTEANPAPPQVGQSQSKHDTPTITIAPSEPPPPTSSQHQRVATASRVGHSAPSLQSDQLKQPHEKRGSQQDLSTPDPTHKQDRNPTNVPDNSTAVVHELPPQIPAVQNIATTSRVSHSALSLQSDQPKQSLAKRHGSQQDLSTPAANKTMQRAVSHDAVPTAHLSAARPGATAHPVRVPGLAPRPQERSVSPNVPREDNPPTTDTQQTSEGPRRLAVAPPSVRRTIANRPPEDNSLETNALFQQRRLSAQVLEYTPTQPQTQPQPPQAHPQPPQSQSQPQQSQGNPVLRRAASSLPSVPSVQE